MSKAGTLLEKLTEMSPYLDMKRQALSTLGSLSMQSVLEGFRFFFALENDMVCYERIDELALIVGIPEGDRFIIVLRMIIQAPHLPVKTMQLKNYKQVEMVNIDKTYARLGAAADIYIAFAAEFDLVSDRYQYLGAKTLWQSVAKQKRVHVHVFDLTARDYLRDSDGKIHKYDGQNITEELIWGQAPHHDERLLVATIREFK